MNQDERRLVTADGRELDTTVETQQQRNELIDAMAKLGRRLRADFNEDRFKRDAGYGGMLIAQ